MAFARSLRPSHLPARYHHPNTCSKAPRTHGGTNSRVHKLISGVQAPLLGLFLIRGLPFMAAGRKRHTSSGSKVKMSVMLFRRRKTCDQGKRGQIYTRQLFLKNRQHPFLLLLFDFPSHVNSGKGSTIFFTECSSRRYHTPTPLAALRPRWPQWL